MADYLACTFCGNEPAVSLTPRFNLIGPNCIKQGLHWVDYPDQEMRKNA